MVRGLVEDTISSFRQVYGNSGRCESDTTLNDSLLAHGSPPSSVPSSPYERLATSDKMETDEEEEKKLAMPSRAWQVIEEIPHFVPALEGARGLFVLMVQWTHIGTHWSQIYFAQGGVAVFFVLSGFLITGILLNLQKQFGRRFKSRFAHLKQFYTDRFVRLYPALLFMIVATCFFRYYWSGTISEPETWPDIFAALFYVMDLRFAIVWGPSFYHVTWSLGVEEKFYILWSLLLPFVAMLTMRGKFALLTTLFTISLGLHLTWYLVNPMWDSYLLGRFTPLCQFWKMILGASLRLLPTPQWFRTRKSAWYGLALLSLPWFLTYYGPHIDTTTWSFPPRNDLSAEMFWEVIASFAGVFIICGSLEGNTFLELETMRFIGRISYAWYLWQLPLLRITGGIPDGWLHGYLGFTTTCFAFLCAVGSTLYIEEPLRMRYRKWKSSKESARLP